LQGVHFSILRKNYDKFLFKRSPKYLNFSLALGPLIASPRLKETNTDAAE
jgi:hypothetical protein